MYIYKYTNIIFLFTYFIHINVLYIVSLLQLSSLYATSLCYLFLADSLPSCISLSAFHCYNIYLSLPATPLSDRHVYPSVKPPPSAIIVKSYHTSPLSLFYPRKQKHAEALTFGCSGTSSSPRP